MLRQVGTRKTVFVYDATGSLAAEYDTLPVAAGSGGVSYLTQDHLGSTRLVTNAAGTDVERYDYLPYGQDLPRAGYSGSAYPGGVPVRFTGKERDSETGWDYFLARYYSGGMGRFTSPDEFPGGVVDPFTGQQVAQPGPLPYADIGDPQTLNKYGYVRNNPLRYVDPDGHAEVELEQFLVNALTATGAAAGAFIGAGAGGAGGGLVGAFVGGAGAIPGAAVGGVAGAAAGGAIGGAVGYGIGNAAVFLSQMINGGQSGGSGQGKSSDYNDKTKGASTKNRGTDVSRADFEKNLSDSGWKKSVSKDGKVVNYEKDGAKYALRDGAKSTGGPTADFYKAGSKKIDLKIRLDEPKQP